MGKKTSTRNRNVMKRHKPTRDERSWVVGMAKAGVSINDVALHFDIHWVTAYRSINRFWQIGLVWDHPRSYKAKENHSTWGTLIHITSRRERFFFGQIRFAERLWTVSGTRVSVKTAQNRLLCTSRMVKILIFCPVQNIFMTGPALHTNWIFQRFMKDFILNKIVIAFTAKILIKFV